MARRVMNDKIEVWGGNGHLRADSGGTLVDISCLVERWDLVSQAGDVRKVVLTLNADDDRLLINGRTVPEMLGEEE